MGIIYGKDAAVKIGSNVESTVDGWMIEYDGNLSPYVASNTQGGTGREGGNKDWTGWYRRLGAIPLVFAGDSFTGIWSVDGTNGVTGIARCERIQWGWDTEAGDYIDARIEFGANGSLVLGAAAAADSATPNPTNVKGLSIWLDGVKQSEVYRMRLIAQRKLRRYCTAECDGQFHRISSDLDMIAMWQVYEDDPAQFPVIHASHQVEIMASDTPTYWTIQWMRIESVRPFGVDRRNTEKPIGATIIATFDAFSSTMAGSVVAPDGTTKWPA